MISKLSVEEFLAKIAVDDLPGSGSVAALVGAAGISQLMKIAKLSNIRLSGDAAIDSLPKLHNDITQIIEQDVAVMKEALPLLLAIGADGDSKAWNAVLTKAAAVMFCLAECCKQGLHAAQILLPVVSANLRCDIKAAALNCHAALQSSLLLAELNVSLLREDDILSKQLLQKADMLAEAGATSIDKLLT